MNFVSMLKLVFSRSAFLRAELNHIEAMRKAGEAYQPAEEFRPEATARIRAKRRNLLKSAVWVLLLVAGGALAALWINSVWPLSWLSIRIVRAVSIVLLAWAVWSKLGDIETFKKQTLLEVTSQYLYKVTYSAGIALGSLALFLEGPSGA